MRRSSSTAIGRFFGGKKDDDESGIDTCPWLYEFKLGTDHREYTLRCVTRDDLKHWIHIYQLIIEMNEQGINIADYNPFDYEAKHKSKVLSAR